MTAHDEAATLAEPGELIRGHGAAGDIGVVDDRPYGLAAGLLSRNLLDLEAHALLDNREHLLHRTAGGRDAGAQRRLDLPDGTRQIIGRRLPVR
jgi:hypothetical protein